MHKLNAQTYLSLAQTAQTYLAKHCTDYPYGAVSPRGLCVHLLKFVHRLVEVCAAKFVQIHSGCSLA